MDRLRRIAEFWNWLPAFRVVAETGHLPTASKLLFVTPSALSRSLRLLEAKVGRRLFDRDGRRLRLNAEGERFLASVRDSMRLVHEGLSSFSAPTDEAPIHISAHRLFVHALLPVITALRARRPGLVPCLYSLPSSEINALLLRGQLDAAFLPDPVPHSRLRMEEAGAVAISVYCGRRHPLFGAKRPSLKQVLRHPFVAPALAEARPPGDGWPMALVRHVGMRTSLLGASVAACSQGSLLAVLPRPAAAPYEAIGMLRRLPLRVVPPISCYAVRRETIAGTSIVDELIAAVRRADRAPDGQR